VVNFENSRTQSLLAPSVPLAPELLTQHYTVFIYVIYIEKIRSLSLHTKKARRKKIYMARFCRAIYIPFEDWPYIILIILFLLSIGLFYYFKS